MNLDRNNYEEFFLLYVDNELTDMEKREVETFCIENTDLREELAMLQASKIQPETSLFFEDKYGLLKRTTENSIDPAGESEELFLLYIDQELDEAGRKSVEKITAMDPSLEKDLQILQQTLLEPDHSVVFKGKEILFRKKETRRFVMLPRLAAAALLLFVAGYFLLEHPKPGKNLAVGIPRNVGKALNENKEKKDLPSVTPPPVDSLYQTAGRDDRYLTESKIQKQGKPDINNHPVQLLSRKKENRNYNDVSLNPLHPVKIPENKRESPVTGPSKDLSLPEIGKTNTALELKPKLLSGDLVAKTDNPGVREGFQVATENSPDIEDGIFMNASSENKNRMRGFFRKVSRVLDKTISVDPGNKKRGLRIGNYQIALK